MLKNFIKPNLFADYKSIKEAYFSSLREGNFSSVACKIHQQYTKESLKINQMQISSKEYNVSVVYGNTILIQLRVACKKKTICKNIAALKYLEIYFFETFKDLYENLLGEVCPVPAYIKDILTASEDRRK